MVDGHAHRRFCAIAQKWRALAERRHDHFGELYRSGRWKFYYTEEEFVLRLRAVKSIVERWAAVAPRPSDEHKPQGAVPQADPAQSHLDRSAA